jgi:hypothetical protein
MPFPYNRQTRRTVKSVFAIERPRTLQPIGAKAPPDPNMREILRSNDTVLLSFAVSILQERGIANLLADQHISIVEGSIGAFPRRLLVKDEDWAAARRALHDAGLEAWLIGDEEARA